MKDKKKKIFLIGIALIILIAIIVVTLVGDPNQEKKEKNENNEQTTVLNEGVTELDDLSELENTSSAEVETAKDFVEPGKDTVDIDKIQGFKPDKDKSPSDEAESTNEIEINYDDEIVLSDSKLSIEAIGGYTGNYIEDGSDDSIVNVAAIVITNHSEQMLQVADVTFEIDENRTAVFRVTNLLPDTSALVLERNKIEYNSEDDYSYGTVATAYLDNPTLMEDEFEFVRENGKLTLKNKTGNTYKKIYVYYKYAQVGGVYMGGITYRVPFENVKPNTSVESVANHFNKDSSRIIDVQIAEQ